MCGNEQCVYEEWQAELENTFEMNENEGTTHQNLRAIAK